MNSLFVTTAPSALDKWSISARPMMSSSMAWMVRSMEWTVVLLKVGPTRRAYAGPRSKSQRLANTVKQGQPSYGVSCLSYINQWAQFISEDESGCGSIELGIL